MKSITRISFIIALTALLSSCGGNEEEFIPPIQQDYLTAHIGNNKTVECITDDEGGKYTNMSITLPDEVLEKENVIVRLRANYVVEKEKGNDFINVISCYPMPIINPMSSRDIMQRFPDMGDDKVDNVSAVWKGYKFLNVTLYLMNSGKPCDVLLEEINVEDKADKGIVYLKVRYDKKENKDFYRSRFYYSFPIMKYLQNKKALELHLKVDTEKGQKEYILNYN